MATLNELLSKETVDKMLRLQTIELSPLAYMRGRTFKNAFIIADEMQNSSPTQMRMLTTRIGEHSKMVINFFGVGMEVPLLMLNICQRN
mgnify:CR=1 FL=1